MAMKQKAVIRVTISDPKKSRTKALKIAATFSGVESVAIKGDHKDELEVIGEGIDTVGLAKLLRKNVGSADLISVGPAKDKKEIEGDQVVWSTPYPYYGGGPPYQVYSVRDSYPDPNCSIM